MYRLAVCEDETETREALQALCKEILTELGVAHTLAVFSSAEALETALRNGAVFDLLCLDILMGGKSGMELAREVREYDNKVRSPQHSTATAPQNTPTSCTWTSPTWASPRWRWSRSRTASGC